MYKHKMRITVRRSGEKLVSIAEFKKLLCIKKLTSRWVGQAKKMMIIVSESSIQKVEIKEV